MIKIRAIALGLLFFSFGPTAFGSAAPVYFIESVDGDQAVIIFDGENLKPRNAYQGAPLKAWDVVQTTRLSSIKIRYPDNSLVVVGRDTKFTLQPRQQGTQYNQLDWGQVRAQVTQPKSIDPEAPPRFVIRTRTATMGVRGTDFIAGYESLSGQSSLQTIEGTVEIAASDTQVLAWKGTPVSAGHTATLGAGSATPTLGDFTPLAYQEKSKIEQPEISSLPERPADAPVRAPASIERDPNDPWIAQSQERLNGTELSALLRFRLGAVSLFQNTSQSNGIQYTTLAPSWNPMVRLFGPLTLVGHGGGFIVKNAVTHASIPIFMGGALLDLQAFGSFHFEAGAGAQIISTDTNGKFTLPYAMGNVVWEFAPGQWINQIYGGYTVLPTVISQGGAPSEASAGVGFNF